MHAVSVKDARARLPELDELVRFGRAIIVYETVLASRNRYCP